MSRTPRTGRVSDLAPGRPTRDEVFPAHTGPPAASVLSTTDTGARASSATSRVISCRPAVLGQPTRMSGRLAGPSCSVACEHGRVLAGNDDRIGLITDAPTNHGLN
jgi:hypothetical protein